MQQNEAIGKEVNYSLCLHIDVYLPKYMLFTTIQTCFHFKKKIKAPNSNLYLPPSSHLQTEPLTILKYVLTPSCLWGLGMQLSNRMTA